MRGPLLIDRRVSAAILLAAGVQCVSVVMWFGAAAERLDTLERGAREMDGDRVKVAKLETQLDLIHRQLDRIEARLETQP